VSSTPEVHLAPHSAWHKGQRARSQARTRNLGANENACPKSTRETGRSISGNEQEPWLGDSGDLHKPTINGLN